MSDFPVVLTNAVDGDPPTGTEIVAKHLNNVEAKIGVDGSAVTTSLDYLLKNAASIDPGHKHTAGAFSGGNDGDVFYKAAGAWGPGTPDAAGLVAKSGDQSIAGIKTFSSIPVGPASAPTTANQLAQKAYVDLMLPLAGGSMTGNIAMSAHKITGLAAASASGQAIRYDEWIATQDPGHKHSALWASGGSPQAVWVDAAGNVGINKPDPGLPLDVAKAQSSLLRLYDTSAYAAGVGGMILFAGNYQPDQAPAFYAAIQGYKENSTSFNYLGGVKFFYSDIANNLQVGVTLNSSGNIGIPKTNPVYLLDMEVSGGGYYSVSDHAWHNGSSIRWKENISPIKNPLAILQKLAGVTFNWKDTGIPGMSLVAEEVGQVIPEAVSFSKEDPRFADGINPLVLVSLLVEGFKAQQAQIEALQAKLN